jgi:hypothetical protein
MCELPRPCSTVRQAHEALRTPAARSRSRSALDRPIRQGEWFFVVPETAEIAELERELDEGAKATRPRSHYRLGNRVVVRRKASINAFIPRSGKPHVADEIAVNVRPQNGAGDGVGNGARVYARGAVRHPDHKTVHLKQWRRVVKNLEVDQARSPLGGGWMD